MSIKKFYESIEDLPLYNWSKINEGMLEYLLIDHSKKASEEELNNAYNILYDDYILRLGLSKEYKKLLLVMKKKALYELDFIISEDKFYLTKIEVEEQKLKDLIKGEETSNQIEKTLIYLSKWIGYRLAIKEISTLEFYTILNEYGKAN